MPGGLSSIELEERGVFTGKFNYFKPIINITIIKIKIIINNNNNNKNNNNNNLNNNKIKKK